MPQEQSGMSDAEGGGGQIVVRPKVCVIAIAKREGKKFLSAGQYVHAIDLVKRLADFNDSQEMSDLRIEPIAGLVLFQNNLVKMLSW